MPPETATLIQCGLSGQTPSTTVAEKACQALVRQGKADLAAAILRDILGYHENAYARISGIAQTRQTALYICNATSPEEAHQQMGESGYQYKMDPLSDEALDFVVEYIVDRNC